MFDLTSSKKKICDDSDDDGLDELPTQDVGVNTEEDRESEKLEARIMELEGNVKEMTESGHSVSSFSLESIASDDVKVAFYTVFLRISISESASSSI